MCKNELVKNASIIFYEEVNDTCLSLMSDKKSQRKAELLETDNYPFDGIFLQDTNSNFRVEVRCDTKLKEPEFTVENGMLKVKGVPGCGNDDLLARFMAKHPFIIKFSLILLGGFLLVLGGIMWGKMKFVFGFCFGFFLSIYLISIYSFINSNTYSFLTLFVIGCCIGLGFVLFFDKMKRTSYFFIGLSFGYLSVHIVLIYLQVQVEYWDAVMMQLLIGIIIGGITLAAKKYMMGITTSLMGGFLLVYNLGSLLGFLDNIPELWN